MGYVYDWETNLYYLQSRYYNPTWCRFLNADSFVSTGQGVLGNNMFTYCLNNQVNMCDSTGCAPKLLKKAWNWAKEKIVQPIKIITDTVKTADEAGTIDVGMAGCHSIQATRSFRKAITYTVTPIPTPVDEAFAVGYELKGMYHLIRGIGRIIK